MNDAKNNTIWKEREQELTERLQELEKKYNELERFSYTVTHDLKAPLRAINNLSKWIEDDLGENVSEEIRTNMKMLHSRIQRMENLINGILQYSKAGRISTEKENVNVNDLVAEITEVLSPSKELTITVQHGMPELFTQKIALEQIFQNLLSNAIKFHHQHNGKITVSCKESDDCYEFSVSDDGPGIEQEFHEKIFEPFQSLQSKDKVEGTGIGLAIVKKIVESKGGKVKLVSGKGSGTTISFTWIKNT